MSEPSHGLEGFLASLSDRTPTNTGISVHIQPQAGHINLRANSANADFVTAASSVLSQDLPVLANTMSYLNDHIFWLGPNEWTIITPLADKDDLIRQLRAAIAADQATLTDVSGGFVIFHLSGPDVENVLIKGCSLDFHPTAFGAGCCAQTILAKVNVLIGQLDNPPVLELVVRRSFAEHLLLWLQHSGVEYGITFTSPR